MAAPAFPGTLPPPQKEGYGINPATEFLRTEFEVGPARHRRVFTGSFATVPVSWQFTSAQLITYREFYQNTISAGARSFTLNLWLDYRFTNALVRFKKRPAENFKGPFSWEVAGEVEVLQELPTS
jgi:hypothetical protein